MGRKPFWAPEKLEYLSTFKKRPRKSAISYSFPLETVKLQTIALVDVIVLQTIALIDALY